MAYSEISASSFREQPTLFFHRVREGEDFPEIAAKYNVDINKILADNTGVEPQPGEVVVIDLKINSFKTSRS